MANSNSSAGCREFRQFQATRRHLLSAGGLGLLGIGLPDLLAAQEGLSHTPRAKSVIFYHHYGAPSHIDTFDPKPKAPAEIRGEFGAINSSAPGFQVGEIMPKIAQVCDRLCVIRSMNHRVANHNPGVYLAITGRTSAVDRVQVGTTPTDWPNYGAVLAKVAPGDRSLPVAVQVPHWAYDQIYTCPGQTAGMLGSSYDPLIIAKDPNDPNFQVDELTLQITSTRLQDRRGLLKSLEGQFRRFENNLRVSGMSRFKERAFSMLTSSRAQQAFQLARESDSVRDRYGRNKSGQSLLLARRLIEAGVRFVTVFSGSNPGDGWDTHRNNFYRLKNQLMPPEDQGFSALIEDMDQRGLLEDTLVVWSGEFGRKPQIGRPNPAVNNIGPGGRDHWPQCYSLVLAGAGVKRGFVYSQSDRIGSHPQSHPHTPADMAATIFWALGLNPKTELIDQFDRPFRLADGEPMRGVFS